MGSNIGATLTRTFRKQIRMIKLLRKYHHSTDQHSTGKQWRSVFQSEEVAETVNDLRSDISRYSETPLTLVLIGHTGSGKSSLINSIFSVDSGELRDASTTKSNDVSGFGTNSFRTYQGSKFAGKNTLIPNLTICDTMGVTDMLGEDDGISEEELKCVCDGRVPENFKFGEKRTPSDDQIVHRADCIIITIAADILFKLDPRSNTPLLKKMKKLHELIPEDIARIVVITKMDTVDKDVEEDVRFLYISKKSKSLLDKAQTIFGSEENHIFLVVNFKTENELDPCKSVPILFALKYALSFANDRKKLHQ